MQDPLEVRILVLHDDLEITGRLADEYAKIYLGKSDPVTGRRYLVVGKIVGNAFDAIVALHRSTWDVVCLAGRYASICVNDLVWYNWPVGRVDYCGQYADIVRLRAAGYNVTYCRPMAGKEITNG
jgi:hypothetical protein